MGGQPLEDTYDASIDVTFELVRRAVSDLGFSIKHIDSVSRIISVNTGRSMKSLAGQDLTASCFHVNGKGTTVSVSGSLAKGGNPFGGGSQLFAWGEKGTLSRKLLSHIDNYIADMTTEQRWPQPSESNKASINSDSLVSQLRELAALKDSGDLEEHEYQAAKERLLGA